MAKMLTSRLLPVALFLACLVAGSLPRAATPLLPAPKKKITLDGQWNVLVEDWVQQRGTVRTGTNQGGDWNGFDFTFHDTKVVEYLFGSCGTEFRHHFEYRLRAEEEPMWLDLINHKDKVVQLGIVKVKGDTMTWMRGKHVRLDEWQKSAGRVRGRPTAFSVKDSDGGESLLLLERHREE
jgi:hypothetical protein